MSHAIALPAPRVFRLPRVKFKRPRWPKGNRTYLVLCLIFVAPSVVNVVIGKVTGEWNALGLPWTAFWGTFSGRMWWRSRRDDDGPSAT